MGATYMPKCDGDSCILVRTTKETLYKWAESDAKFIRSVSFNGRGMDSDPFAPRLTRTLSTNCCLDGEGQLTVANRQIFLRSYSFSKKESMPQKVRNCANRIKRSVSMHAPNKKVSDGGGGGGTVVSRKAKKISSVVNMIFRKLLSMSTKVEVVG